MPRMPTLESAFFLETLTCATCIEAVGTEATLANDNVNKPVGNEAAGVEVAFSNVDVSKAVGIEAAGKKVILGTVDVDKPVYS